MGPGMLKMLLPDLDIDGVMNNINIALITVREIKEVLNLLVNQGVRLETQGQIIEDRINWIEEKITSITVKPEIENDMQINYGKISRHSVPEGIAALEGGADNPILKTLDGDSIAENKNEYLKPTE